MKYLEKIKIYTFYLTFLLVSFLILNYLWILNNKDTSFSEFFFFMQGPHHFHMPYDLILNDFSNIIYIFNQPLLYSLQKYLEYKIKFYLFDTYVTGINETSIIVISFHLIIGAYAFYGLHQLALYLKIGKLIIIGSFFIIFSPSYYFLITFNAYDFITMAMITIVTYRMIKFLKFQNLFNLFFFLLTLFIISNYRNFFHPFLFCIPILIGCFFFVTEKIKRYLLLSFICIFISSLNVIKNFFFFDTLLIGIGPYAKARIYGSYEFQNKDLLIKLIDAKKISPINICFSQETMVKYFYKNEEFNLKKCQFEIFEKYLRDDVELFKQKHPELEKVEFLDTHTKSKLFPDGSEINFFNISSGFIPNTLLGLVAAKKIIEDVDVYQNYARKNFFSGVKSSLVLFFRSGNSYMFNIAGNPFNYPEYFSSNLWNLDFLPKLAERKDLKVDTAPRKIVAIIILLSSLNTIFYILSVKQLTSNLILLFLCAIILISKIDNFKNIILIVFIFICCLYLFVLFKKTYEYVCCKLSNKNIVLENRDIIFFIYSIYFYFIIALVLTTPGEVERYRLVVDPLVALFSIFYLKKIMITLKKLILNIKKYYLF